MISLFCKTELCQFCWYCVTSQPDYLIAELCLYDCCVPLNISYLLFPSLQETTSELCCLSDGEEGSLYELFYTVAQKIRTPVIFLKYLQQIFIGIDNFWCTESMKSLQRSHMLFTSFDKTEYHLRWMQQQRFYTVCQETGPLHSCNKKQRQS